LVSIRLVSGLTMPDGNSSGIFALVRSDTQVLICWRAASGAPPKSTGCGAAP
jgi:hypothetical protein